MNRDEFKFSPKHAAVEKPQASFLLLLAALFFCWLAGPAAAATAPEATVLACSSSITSCGCTITKSGYYEIDAALDNTQGLTALGDCIDVKASNVLLNGNVETITGAGNGVGLRVLKSAKNARIAGNEMTITGWNIGMEIDSTNTVTDWVNTNNNTAAGVFLNSAHKANVTDFGAENNSIFGIWVRGGANNSVNCNHTESNGEIGLYVGCHGDGSFGTKCKGVSGSKANRFYDTHSYANGNAGIVIDVGNTKNIIADWNGSGNLGTHDSVDENTGCDGDQWLPGPAYTDYGNVNQSCIP